MREIEKISYVEEGSPENVGKIALAQLASAKSRTTLTERRGGPIYFRTLLDDHYACHPAKQSWP
jgi:hypothetical protein